MYIFIKFIFKKNVAAQFSRAIKSCVKLTGHLGKIIRPPSTYTPSQTHIYTYISLYHILISLVPLSYPGTTENTLWYSKWYIYYNLKLSIALVTMEIFSFIIRQAGFNLIYY
ncbi:hypothetical protein PUN28_001194 [Cardiocondyla obscurior]|uniref:Uncharacterized protein n=1 Tax=Cardiocondyla obscurior TaxID=286306 RepID=A0AAW2H3N9_9HYME